MTIRKLKGLVLIGTLLAGGVLAPVSHFVYMAASDSGIAGMAGMAAMHHGQAKQNAASSTDGLRLTDASTGYVACTYAALFATQMAGDTPPSDHFVAPTFVELEHAIRHQTRICTAEATRSIRGPPSSRAAVG